MRVLRTLGAVAVTAALVVGVAPGPATALDPAPPLPGVGRFARSIPADVTQVIVVTARSWRRTSGVLTAYERTATGWRRTLVTPARLGRTGLVPAAQRVQDSGRTPAGLFTITATFGRAADPGTAMPYTRLTDDHWWVQDRRSRYYNQMRLGSRGGFMRRTRGRNSSEHLARMGAQYDYAAVIDFNRPRPVIGRGSGIFLHAFGDLTTVGCVSVERGRMRAILRWLDPAAHPRIVIGEDDWLAAPA